MDGSRLSASLLYAPYGHGCLSEINGNFHSADASVAKSSGASDMVAFTYFSDSIALSSGSWALPNRGKPQRKRRLTVPETHGSLGTHDTRTSTEQCCSTCLLLLYTYID